VLGIHYAGMEVASSFFPTHRGRCHVKVLSCFLVGLVWALGALVQSAAVQGQEMPKVAVAKPQPQAVASQAAAPQRAVRLFNGRYWYQMASGQWLVWQQGQWVAAAVAAPRVATTPQPYTAYRYSYDPNTGGAAQPLQALNQEMRSLQQEVMRLREANARQTIQNDASGEFPAEAWWDKQQRGMGDSDPALFQ
jgi:hypothetical protein